MILNNSCLRNNGTGIEIRGSHENQVIHNTCRKNREGIRIDGGSNNTIMENLCENNSIWGISISQSSFNLVMNNICASQPQGITMSHSQRNTVQYNRCENNSGTGVVLIESFNNSILDNRLANNQKGISLIESNFTHISNNSIMSNVVGLFVVYSSSLNTLQNNSFHSNTQFGVKVENNSGFIVYAAENYWGHSSGPHHPELNPHGIGDNVSDDVLFDPWLDAHGNLVSPPPIPEDDPSWLPLYLLFIILVGLFGLLVLVVHSSKSLLGGIGHEAQTSSAGPTWDSSDITEITGKLITCEYCQRAFEVAEDERSIRVPCPHCKKNTLATGK